MTVIATARSAGVDDLGPAELLARVTDAEQAERIAARDKLELAVQWCVLHPATSDTGVAVWGDAGLPGLTDCDERLGGEGCPSVAAFAPEPFAAALGVSTLTGMQLLADALDLAHRLPQIWSRVRRLEVPAWRARRVAQATHALSRAGAAYVDAQLAGRLASCGSGAIDRVVAQAAATYDPETHADREATGRDAWDVRLHHRTDGGWAGTSELQATGDTLDLTKLYDLVCDRAAHLARLGDTDDLGARKAKALGTIADAQSILDLGPADASGTMPRPSLAKTRLYLHLKGADLLDDLAGTTTVGEAERLGPATVARIKEWLSGSRATIVPVLDLGRDDGVDRHVPPAWMREVVILRDRHCVFPWCSRDARACDLDHITPYVPVDEGGPPGQTRPSALAPLCRRHRRAKTAGRWRYRRERDGTCTWRGPHGSTYVVTAVGTIATAQPRTPAGP